MARPYALLRAGFPYVKTIGMRRVTNYAYDIALGRDDVYYVLCRGEGTAEIRRLTWDDEDKGVISARGRDDGKLEWPASIIIDREEKLYVSDEYLNRISVFSKEGEFLSKWGEPGEGAGQLNRPSGIAFDAEENIYVSDTLNHRVQKFTKDGKFLMKWGSHGDGDGELDMPWGIKVDELGDVYVADWRNDRVQKFTADGEFVFALGRSGGGDGEFNRPTGVEVDSDGDIYVADWGNDRVQLFSARGRYVDKFIGDATLSRSGISYLLTNAKPLRLREMSRLEPQRRLRNPVSVRVDDKGRMFVTDYGSYRIQIYQKQAIPLTPAQIGPELKAPTLQVT